MALHARYAELVQKSRKDHIKFENESAIMSDESILWFDSQ